MSSQPVPAEIDEALSRHPQLVQKLLLQIREIIFAVAAETEGVGMLTETLKWGEPAYLTEESKSGTTIRLGATKMRPGSCAVLFNCKTSLAEHFRTHFATDFEFEGTRALIINPNTPLQGRPLRLFLRAALTYHRQKRPGFY